MTILGYLIFYLICALNVIWGVRKRRSNALYAIAFVVIFILMTFNFEGPDIGVYKLTYENVGNATSNVYRVTYMEWGYTTLMSWGNKIGLDFFGFRIVLSFACLCLFGSSIKYYNANGNLIIGLYMLYLFFFDAIQLRNCIAQFIILFATRYLTKRTWSSTLKYILCVIVASSIHTIAWIYLSFLLVKFLNNQKFFKNLFIFAGMLFFVSVIMQPVLPQIVNSVLNFIGHGTNYGQGRIHYGYWIVLGIHLLSVVPIYLCKNCIKDKDKRNKIILIMNLNIILCLFLPLTLLNNNFNRIFRNNMILTQIGLALIYSNSAKKSRSGCTAFGSLLLFTAGWYFSDMLRYEISNIIIPIIEKNLIFDFTSLTNFRQYVFVIFICLLIFFAVRKMFSYHRKVMYHKRSIKCA